eukprot:CAMPEP_0169249038 /NCGR_PEP_ID=MMETSP1016-20121227/36188_1 /TAXON_ID=342587 /ORGANISM="Karlodinium micrum, Strain CCMP2283" /LENGTH=412 /DNA_ID=CAMNT_0009329925 /DNA_START=20 /DNA_END=1258 /DNA_ORIENTATION=-
MTQQHAGAAAAVVAGKDLYGALGVCPSASEADIKKAYREQALRWHPDKAGTSTDATQRFQAISEAYEVLADGDGKRWYDYLRAVSAPPQPRSPTSSWGAGLHTAGNFASRAGPNSANEFYAQAFSQGGGYARGFAYAQVHGVTVNNGMAYAHQAPLGFRRGPAASVEVPSATSPQMQPSPPTPSSGSRAVPEAARAAAARTFPQVPPATSPYMQPSPPTPSSGSRAVPEAVRAATARTFPQGWPPSQQSTASEGGPHVPPSPSTTSRPMVAPEGMRRAATAQTAPQVQSWHPAQRLTAAEVHPEGFDQPDFLATLGDLRALVTFLYGGRSWQPKEVTHVEWGRSTLKPREMRLKFSAEYLIPPGVARSSPEFDLQKHCRTRGALCGISGTPQRTPWLVCAVFVFFDCLSPTR